MTTINESELTIRIESGSPEEYRNWLIKSIAAAIRWNANDNHKRKGDAESLFFLGELLDDLATVEGTEE